MALMNDPEVVSFLNKRQHKLRDGYWSMIDGETVIMKEKIYRKAFYYYLLLLFKFICVLTSKLR